MFCITQLQSVEAPTNLLVLPLTFSGSDSLSENANIFKRGIHLFIGEGERGGGEEEREKIKKALVKRQMYTKNCLSFILQARRT